MIVWKGLRHRGVHRQLKSGGTGLYHERPSAAYIHCLMATATQSTIYLIACRRADQQVYSGWRSSVLPPFRSLPPNLCLENSFRVCSKDKFSFSSAYMVRSHESSRQSSRSCLRQVEHNPLRYLRILQDTYDQMPASMSPFSYTFLPLAPDTR